MKTTLPFTRITNDINGNPRYVCHFLNLDVHGYESNISLSDRYAIAVRLANTIGGRKYHTKKYGGGIVFQSYALDSLVADISRITGLDYSGYAL
jgi:ethanolamine utilization protein EutA (predicted chaperonin)